MPPKADGKLTLKQQTFVNTYVENGGNATEAALTAYNPSSRINASNIGKQNLDKPIISEAINTRLLSFKDNLLNKVNELNSMNIALESAHDDLMDDDPKIRTEARKFILEIAKFLAGNTGTPKEGSKHVHFQLPTFKG